MRIACLIDSLGSGGAEKQLSELAAGLQESGHRVALCHYHGQEAVNDFYETRLRQSGVTVERICSTGKLDRLRRVRAWLSRFQPDVLQAYLPGPNAIAVLTGLAARRWKVVVSERIDLDYRETGSRRIRTIARLYRWADWIVTNSHSSRDALVGFIPAYGSKCSVIWNCVDLNRFRAPAVPRSAVPFRFLCVASMASRKNSRRLVEALAVLRDRSRKPFVLKWVGRCNERIPDHRSNMAETLSLVERFQLGTHFVFAGEIENVESEYREADALALVSTREGLPNVVCEGMASGLPIVAGAVADIPRIVRDGENGFLCDPWNVQDIAEALGKCLDLGPDRRSEFGRASRRSAETLFDKGAFIRKYEDLYGRLLGGGPGFRPEERAPSAASGGLSP